MILIWCYYLVSTESVLLSSLQLWYYYPFFIFFVCDDLVILFTDYDGCFTCYILNQVDIMRYKMFIAKFK